MAFGLGWVGKITFRFWIFMFCFWYWCWLVLAGVFLGGLKWCFFVQSRSAVYFVLRSCITYIHTCKLKLNIFVQDSEFLWMEIDIYFMSHHSQRNSTEIRNKT